MARTVLLADDSVTAQNMGRRILTDAGYEVITVNNGSAALKKVHESRPDLIVLDVYMPGYGGLEVCQRLKESGETMRIPVLLTVGKMEPFKSDEAKRVRADGHIVKPFEASELLAALTKLEDKIVPGVDGRARKGKADKKSRSWHAGEDPAVPPTEWSDRVAYLAGAKQRLVNNEPEVAPEPEVAAPRRPKAVEPSEPAPEMAVVAEPVTDEAARVSDVRAEQTESSHATDESLQGQAQTNFEQASSTTPGSGQHEESETRAAASEPATSDQEERAAPVSTPAPVPVRPRWVAESVALSAEEAALHLDREMQESNAPSATSESVSATPEIAPAESSAKVAGFDSEDRNGAAFAAAASASPASNAVASAPQAPASTEEEPAPAGLDASAAWKNWQQIRDSVMSAQNAGAIETAVSAITNAGASATASETTASAGTAETNDDPSTQSLQGEALASIVDTVLAELKPKLMEQIAKKLAAEKK